MKDLLLALYSLIILYNSGKPVKEAYPLLRSPGLKPFFAKIPALKPTIDNAIRGDLDYSELGDDLRTFLLEYAKSADSKASVKAVLQAVTRWMRTSSPVAMANIERYSASTFFPSWMGTYFVKEVDDQAPVKVKLRQVMKKMTGTPALAFDDVEEAKAAKEASPELYTEYLRLRKQFNTIWKLALANFVRSSGGKTVSFEKFIAFLKKKGIEHTLPSGFTGNMDAVGNFYTSDEEVINGVPQAAIFPTVRMNPSYEKGSQEYVFQAIRKDGSGGNYFYTKQANREKNVEKFEAVKDFIPIVDKVRAKWIQELKRYDPTSPDSVSALVLELLFQFNARIGSGTKPGLRPILRKNYTAIQNGFRLKYLGKDQVLTKHEMKGTDPVSKMIVKLVGMLAEGKRPTDPLFTYESSTGGKIIPYGAVLKYFRKLGANVPVHKLRTYHGTKIFRAQLENIFKKKKTMESAKEALAYLKQAATEVGKALNHVRRSSEGEQTVTPMTALGSYIDPTAQIEFFEHYGLPLPLFLERRVPGKESGIESNSVTEPRAPNTTPLNSGDTWAPVMEEIQIESAEDEPVDESLEPDAETTEDPGMDPSMEPSAEEGMDGETPDDGSLPDEGAGDMEAMEPEPTSEDDLLERAEKQNEAEDQLVELRDEKMKKDLADKLGEQATEIAREVLDGGDAPSSQADRISKNTNVLRGER
jgi:hypothetical protein